MSKQDGYASRTAADLERKYNFGQTFAEVYGLVTDARKIAEEAQSAIEGLDQEQIFNLLTNNGKAQGIYRDDNGDVYVNASFIRSGTLSDEQLPSSVALKSEIPKALSELVNDKGFVAESGVTTIVKGVVTTDYVNALGLKVKAANITGTLTIGQLPSDVATTSDLNGFVNEATVTTITNNAIKTASISADQITAGTFTGVSLETEVDPYHGHVYLYRNCVQFVGSSINCAAIIEHNYGTLAIRADTIELNATSEPYMKFFVGSGYWVISEEKIYYVDSSGNVAREAEMIEYY